MKKALGFALVVIIGAALTVGYRLGWPTEKTGGVTVITAGNVPHGTKAAVEATIKTFAELMRDTAGLKFKHEVTVYIAAEAPDYLTVLTEKFALPPAAAEEIAAVSGGWSEGEHHLVALNGGAAVMQTPGSCAETTAHELFHQMQQQLSPGSEGFFWLEEGSADYVGALVAEKMGLKRRGKWQRDNLAALRIAPETISPQSLLQVDLTGRKKIMAPQYHAYQVSDQMVSFLISQREEGRRLADICRYFAVLAETGSGEAALKEVFDWETAPFLAAYGRWQKERLNEPADFLFTTNHSGGDKQARELERELSAGEVLLRRLGAPSLKGEYHILLAKDTSDMAAQLIAEAGFTADKGAALAQGSLWVEQGSTVIINGGELAAEKQLAFTAAVMQTRFLITQLTAACDDEMEWLTRGLAYLVGIRRLCELGEGTMADYRRTWLLHLQKGRVPPLTQLMPKAAFVNAANYYEDNRISELAELATLTLAQNHGWEKLWEWLKAARKSGSYQDAFRRVYGQSPADFSERFARWQLGAHSDFP